ncbi:MAG: hypothetical protein R2875_16680 [Desulfobacterales bacterium]
MLEQPAGTFSGRMVASPDTFGYILDFPQGIWMPGPSGKQPLIWAAGMNW